MKSRVFEFVTGIETSVQPDSGTPVLPNDIATKAYVDSVAGGGGTEIQDAFAGPGTVFILTQTPVSAASVKVYKNGSFIRNTSYTLVGTTLTMTVALTALQELDVVYSY